MTERCEMEKLSLTYFNVKRASYGKIFEMLLLVIIKKIT